MRVALDSQAIAYLRSPGIAHDTKSSFHFTVNGHGKSGKLQFSLLRDTNSLDEHKYTAEIDYAGEASDHGIPWGAFQLTTKNVTAPPMACPFDGLVVSGTRENGTPVTIEAIAFMSKPANCKSTCRADCCVPS